MNTTISAPLALAAMLALACAGQALPRRPVIGLRAVDENLPWFDSRTEGETALAITSLGRPHMASPMSLTLSRFRYPAEDGHLDAIVRFDMELGQQPEGRLEVALRTEDGTAVSEQAIASIPGGQLHFSYRFPEAMAGRGGALALRWIRQGQPDAVAEAPFAVAPALGAEQSGRIPLTVPNDSGATLRAAPMTAGVPFPLGALHDAAHLRLVDEAGAEVPLQAMETARWSRFGPVKWVLCDFTVDLAGKPRRLYLEYGPDVRRSARPKMGVETGGGGAPKVDAGRVRWGEDGVAYDVSGGGDFRNVLAPAALLGGFVEHVEGIQYQGWGHRWISQTGMVYAMPEGTEFAVEESGPEKTVLRAEGWYVHPETGRRFCQFVNRYVVHRDSPVVRIFHTWIFTGDGNRDRIRNMGWRFPAGGMAPVGFLSSFGEGAEWLQGYYLRQHGPDEFALFEYDEPVRPAAAMATPALAERGGEWVPARPVKELSKGERAAGVMAAQGNGVRLHVGVQDFWQNFPASLMAEEGALTFYQWPRFGRGVENPVSPEDMGNVWRLWFAHEGEVLSFALPQAIYDGPIYIAEGGVEPRFPHGRPETVNAQGIAKTAEMWLYLADEGEEPGESARVLKGLSDETLRAVVDPEWMARSGAFYEFAHADEEARPEDERAWRLNAESPLRQVERMGVYGKWLYGDLLTGADLDARTATLYRTFRKSHWGWPYSWHPFARTGDARLLRPAQAATRMMTDVAFCHYVGEELEQEFAAFPKHTIWDPTPHQPFRRRGWYEMNLIPWHGYWGTTTRCYVDQADYLWDAWRMTGYHRARDVALAWAEETKIEERDKIGRGLIRGPGRWGANLLKQYVEMYEATWDPWFLAASHAIADMHLWHYRERDDKGHFWGDSQQTYLRYTGRPEFEEFYVNQFAPHWADWQQTGWATPSTLLAPAAFAYHLTGDEHYLRRIKGLLDLARWAVYDAEDAGHYAGYLAVGEGHAHMLFTSWFHIWAPRALAALERAGEAAANVEPLPLAFNQTLAAGTVIAVRKEAGEALTLRVKGRHSITGPEGATVAEGDAPEAVLGAELPAGTYRVSLGARVVAIPISPPGTPEVLIPGEGEKVGAGWQYVQHWFHVPEGTASFRIEFDNTPPTTQYYRQFVRQIAVWDADGREAWAHRQRTVDHDPEQKALVAEVTVPPGQAGRLWRVTLPAQRVSMPFRMDPALPRTLAHDRTRWFAPEG